MKPWIVRPVFAFIIVQFCVRNLPWHLDDFDQAKQAYTSFEMVEQGHWWFQHTPSGAVATKPPLACCISAALYLATHWWDGAWRIPPLASALAILLVLRRAGGQVLPSLGGLVAAAAFGLNLVAPRLATLVRTDMVLTLFIFLTGWLIWKKTRAGVRWEARERWMIFALILGSMMTKEPIAYAFLLPGLVAFHVVCKRRQIPSNAWCGWWPWLAPLGVFLLWAGIGIWKSRDFYEQVVLKEFLGRFTVGEQAVHKNQPVYFYLTHVLRDLMPWSLALLAFCFVKKTRRAFTSRPDALWLVCWAAGGIVLMSLVPSKRPDRIFPALPPLCLLLVYPLREATADLRRAALGCVALAVAISGGYTTWNLTQAYRERGGGLAEFGARVRLFAKQNGFRFAVTNSKDEGMLLYLRQPSFLKFRDAEKAWRDRQLDALVLNAHDFEQRAGTLDAWDLWDASRAGGEEKNSQYFFIVRKEEHAR